MSENLIYLLSKDEQRYYHLVTLKKGEILYHEDDVCREIGIVMEGEISISSYSYHGEEIIYNLLKENDIFGNNLLFSSNPHYLGNILAKKSAKVALIDEKSLLFLLQNNQNFLMHYLNIQSDFSKRLNSTIKLLSFANAEERFLYYLFLHNNQLIYTNVTSLSKALFLQRETLSRLLTRLVQENKIKRNRHFITLMKN